MGCKVFYRDSYYPISSSNAIDLNEISVMKNEHVAEQLTKAEEKVMLDYVSSH